ncbi:7425_t:CDS:1, partial [Acaulospora morrowiae]
NFLISLHETTMDAMQYSKLRSLLQGREMPESMTSRDKQRLLEKS